jgi:hypothetical protein
VGVGGTATLTANVQPSGMTTTWSLTSGAGTVIPQGDLTAEFVANPDDGSATVQACVVGTECCASITLNIVGACAQEGQIPVIPQIQTGTPPGWICSCNNTAVFGCLFFESVTFCPPLACYNVQNNDWVIETSCLYMNFSEQVCVGGDLASCAEKGLAAGVNQLDELVQQAYQYLLDQNPDSITVPFSCSVSTPSAAVSAASDQIADVEDEVYNTAADNWVVAPNSPVDVQDPVPTSAMSTAYDDC